MTRAKLNPNDIAKTAALVDWNFSTANTKGLTHEIHRYSGKYIPQMARGAIELISSPEETILDPYVGSGTTLLEANLSGRHSIGIDLNPLAILISRTKTTPIDEHQLDELCRFFRNVTDEINSSKNGLLSLLPSTTESAFSKEKIINDPRRSDLWYTKWYSESTLDGLIALDLAIKSYPDSETATVARVAFSNILRKCSNAHSGYPNVMLAKNKDNKINPAPLFMRALTETVSKVNILNQELRKEVKCEVRLGDATELDIPSESIDAVVSHPPYIGSVPYAEYGALSLKWLGYDPKELDSKLTGGRRQRKDVVTRFTDGYRRMISESYRVLKSGRYMFLLVGDPVVKGEKVDLAEMTRALAKDTGFTLVAEQKRDGVNRRANKMGHETLFFFQKS